jgi:phospholipid-binding lipoprotein MlaA
VLRLNKSRSERVVVALAAVGAAGALLAGCATAPVSRPPGAAPAPREARHDPFESANRGLFAVGNVLDRTFVRPIIVGYRRIAPRPVRRAIHNLVQNLDEPVVLLNDVLQGHPKAAGKTAVRFVVNSTVGVGGIFDAAATAGLPHHDNGFASTLGRYDVGPGPYIYIPLLGPTSLRDVVGDGVDWFTDPLSWVRFSNARRYDLGRTGLSLLDEREEAEAKLRELERTAVDPYATLRSVYLQSRQAEVKGEDAPLEPLPELQEPPPPAAPASPQTAPAGPPAPAPPPAAGPPDTSPDTPPDTPPATPP